MISDVHAKFVWGGGGGGKVIHRYTGCTLQTFVKHYNSSIHNMDRVKRIWYLSPMRAAKVQASLRIRAVSPEPSLLAHISSESRGTFRQKARSLAPLNGWACAVKICHDGMLEDTNSLDGAHISTHCPCVHQEKSVTKNLMFWNLRERKLKK